MASSDRIELDRVAVQHKTKRNKEAKLSLTQQNRVARYYTIRLRDETKLSGKTESGHDITKRPGEMVPHETQ